MSKRTEHQALFRIEFFVETDKLGKVLWMLAGDALNLTHHPVINARQSGGRIIPKVKGGELLDLFEQHIRRKKLREVTADDAREFCKSHGRREGSYGPPSAHR